MVQNEASYCTAAAHHTPEIMAFAVGMLWSGVRGSNSIDPPQGAISR
jgi:hypothetical protein